MEDKEQTIYRLWENSGHGTRREDVEAAYLAGQAAANARWLEHIHDAITRLMLETTKKS
jgi:hypothetical protein